jgi:cysteine-rich repeat protein
MGSGLRYINDLGYNIDELASCGFSAATKSQPNTDPGVVLGPPIDNGGPTATIALCTGAGTPHSECSGRSPALDAIPAAANGCGAPDDQDQRGLVRPVDGDGDSILGCDIGAFEVQAPAAGVCGDGTVDPGEACDDGNTADGDCCSSTCQLESAGTVCREATGACDVAETCTGTSAACPADAYQPSGTACGNSTTTACTNPDSCNGLGTCEANHKPDGTSCSDRNACTIDDACQAGACTGTQLTCLGANATICGDDGPNLIVGTSGPDVIHGRGGNDIIFGLGGHDLICGGDGHDILFGDAGNDKIDGGAGTNICVGGPGTDTFTRCAVRTQ